MSRSLLGIAALAVQLTACVANPIGVGGNSGGTSGLMDSGPQTVPPPTLSPIPASTPEATVALSGNVKVGQEVVISGGFKAITVSVLPGGQFCADVPLVTGTVNKLQVVALSNGSYSAPAAATTTQDPSAVPPAQLTCNGETQVDSGVDCTMPSLAICAYACNQCVDDAYEPNQNPQTAPALAGPGTYPLTICPCHDDWFALVAPFNALIDAQLQTSPAVQMTVELRVPLGVDGGGAILASAMTQNGNGEVTLTAPYAGLYDLHVFAAPDGGGNYQLVLNDFSMPQDAGPMLVDGGGDAGVVDGGPAVYGPCTGPSGLDAAECNALTPYCDTNRAPAACVATPVSTTGEMCTEDPECNFGLLGTEVVCSTQSKTCVTGSCHSAADCPTTAPTCNMTTFTCG